VNKKHIITNELDGMGTAIDKLFPTSAPYSDVELTPRWDYDFEKAALLNCDADIDTASLPQPHPFPNVDLCSQQNLPDAETEAPDTEAPGTEAPDGFLSTPAPTKADPTPAPTKDETTAVPPVEDESSASGLLILGAYAVVGFF
jgi:hypothetical protein